MPINSLYRNGQKETGEGQVHEPARRSQVQHPASSQVCLKSVKGPRFNLPEIMDQINWDATQKFQKKTFQLSS